jgi:hypothetical protein
MLIRYLLRRYSVLRKADAGSEMLLTWVVEGMGRVIDITRSFGGFLLILFCCRWKDIDCSCNLRYLPNKQCIPINDVDTRTVTIFKVQEQHALT